MKKLLLILLSVLSLTANAEDVKLALLQPLTVPGSTECNPMEISMVRGELRKAFGWQSDFQVLTRMDVDAMLKEQGFQRSGMVDDAQRKQVGIMTGAQYICVSTITKYNTQLYIEAYLVDVETGQMTNPATQYLNVQNDDFSTLPTACGELAKEMLGELSVSSQKQTKVGVVASSKKAGEYVDLGLPSGTKWRENNEEGVYSFYQAQNLFGNSVPTKEQWRELMSYCSWEKIDDGFKVTGPNMQSIILPAMANSSKGDGDYWTSSINNYNHAYNFSFYRDGNLYQKRIFDIYSMTGQIYVRLVK